MSEQQTLDKKLKEKIAKIPSWIYWYIAGLGAILFFAVDWVANPSMHQYFNSIIMIGFGIGALTIFFVMTIVGILGIGIGILTCLYAVREKTIEYLAKFVAEIFKRNEDIPARVAEKINENVNVMTYKDGYEKWRINERLDSLESKVENLQTIMQLNQNINYHCFKCNHEFIPLAPDPLYTIGTTKKPSIFEKYQKRIYECQNCRYQNVIYWLKITITNKIKR